MANKKCPKCGEDNPAEAVMCWACYTPLTAGAGASMGAGMGGATTMPRAGAMGVPGAGVADDGKKKEIDPKLYLLGGLAVVGVLVFLFTSGALGGGQTQVVAPVIQDVGPGDNRFSAGGSPPAPIQQPLPPPAPSGGNSGQTQVVEQPASYSAIISPSPKYTTATFGIVPAQPGASMSDAENLARAARRDMAGNGQWKNAQVFVFTDAASGNAFKQYMNARKGMPLGQGDYAALAAQNAWAGAVVFYETRGNKELVKHPAQNPRSWWTG